MTSPRLPLEPLQVRSRESADRIRRSAIEVITDLGIREFTMAEVAGRAGVSVGGLYGRFPDKEALLYVVKDQALTDLATDIEQALNEADCRVESVIAAFVDTLTRVLFSAERLYAFIFVHSAEDERLRDRGFAFHEQLRRVFLEKMTACGVRDERLLATTYEIIVQSLLMRVISLGHVTQEQTPYPGFPSPGQYATDLAAVAVGAVRGITG